MTDIFLHRQPVFTCSKSTMKTAESVIRRDLTRRDLALRKFTEKK